jgi:transposase
MPKRSSSEDFKREAVARVQAGTRVERVARELGIPSGTLWQWVSDAAGRGRRTGSTGPAPQPTGPVDPVAYQAALQRIADLERENAFLGKASAFFAKQAHP